MTLPSFLPSFRCPLLTATAFTHFLLASFI
jgi:hypothetical protein